MGSIRSYFLESFQPVQLKDAGTAVPHSHYARLMNKVRAAPSPSHPGRTCTEDWAHPGHTCTEDGAHPGHICTRTNRASCARCMLHAMTCARAWGRFAWALAASMAYRVWGHRMADGVAECDGSPVVRAGAGRVLLAHTRAALAH